ncbi:hypothetical protein HDU91_002393 [Kappamyces sp. JEL0680]|nr:hypothetical protein HDU91_002393 [Kappamyces sp. JEL0680]
MALQARGANNESNRHLNSGIDQSESAMDADLTKALLGVDSFILNLTTQGVTETTASAPSSSASGNPATHQHFNAPIRLEQLFPMAQFAAAAIGEQLLPSDLLLASSALIQLWSRFSSDLHAFLAIKVHEWNQARRLFAQQHTIVPFEGMSLSELDSAYLGQILATVRLFSLALHRAIASETTGHNSFISTKLSQFTDQEKRDLEIYLSAVDLSEMPNSMDNVNVNEVWKELLHTYSKDGLMSHLDYIRFCKNYQVSLEDLMVSLMTGQRSQMLFSSEPESISSFDQIFSISSTSVASDE